MSFLSRLRLIGTDRNSQTREMPIENSGAIPVEVAQTTIFNELAVAEKIAEYQQTFPYGVHNTDLIEENTSTGSSSLSFGGATTRAMELSTGTTVTSDLEVSSVKQAKYRSGQGFEGIFAFREEAFGGSDGNYYKVGFGNADVDTFVGFKRENLAFGGGTEIAIHRADGVSGSDYVQQSSWNVDVMDGSDSASNPSGQLLDLSKGNVFKIEFQYLGYGALKFSIENKETGKFQLVHVIMYANTNTLTSLANPTMKFNAQVYNYTNTENVEIHITSGAMFIQGKIVSTNGITNNADVENVNSTLLNGHLFTIRGRSTYGGVTNLVNCMLTQISLHNEANVFDSVHVIQNGTFTGQSFSDINTSNSTVEIDTSGTYTGGTGKILSHYGMPKNGTASINQIIKELEYSLNAGNSISLVTNANSNDVTASLTFSEDF